MNDDSGNRTSKMRVACATTSHDVEEGECPWCTIERLKRERNQLIAAIGDHVTVRSDQYALIQRLTRERDDAARLYGTKEALDALRDRKTLESERAAWEKRAMEAEADWRRLRELVQRAHTIIGIREAAHDTHKGKAWLEQASRELNGEHPLSETGACPFVARLGERSPFCALCSEHLYDHGAAPTKVGTKPCERCGGSGVFDFGGALVLGKKCPDCTGSGLKANCDGATPVRASTAEVVLPSSAEPTASPVQPDDETCTTCEGTGWDNTRQRPCDCRKERS